MRAGGIGHALITPMKTSGNPLASVVGEGVADAVREAPAQADLRRRPESGLDFRTHLGRTSTGATRV